MREFDRSRQSAGAAKTALRSEAADGGEIDADRRDKLDRWHAERCNDLGAAEAVHSLSMSRGPRFVGSSARGTIAPSQTSPVPAILAKPIESRVGQGRPRHEARPSHAGQGQNRRAPPARRLDGLRKHVGRILRSLVDRGEVAPVPDLPAKAAELGLLDDGNQGMQNQASSTEAARPYPTWTRRRRPGRAS